MNRMILLSLGLFTAIGTASVSHAQSRDSKILEVFEKCQNITDDKLRLSCFDAAVLEAPTVAVIERKNEIARRKEDFGLSGLQIEERTDAIAEESPEKALALRTEREDQNPSSVDSTLVSHSISANTRKSLFLLENGQFWAETSNSTLRRMPREGSVVKISKAPLGGYRLTTEERSGFVNVQRIR